MKDNRRQRKPLKHIGLRSQRLVYGRLERLFAEFWIKENDPARRRGINYGKGILQDLLMVPNRDKNHKLIRGFHPGGGYQVRPAFVVNQRDATIAATVVQWLGTNVGFSYICEILRRDGWRISADPDRYEKLPDNEKHIWNGEAHRELLPDRVTLYKLIRESEQAFFIGAYRIEPHYGFDRGPREPGETYTWLYSVGGKRHWGEMTPAETVKRLIADERFAIATKRLP